MSRTLKIVGLLIASALLMACPERPDAAKSAEACENLISIANLERVEQEVSTFKPQTAAQQLKAALAAFAKGLKKGEAGEREAAVEAFKKTFKAKTDDEQKEAAKKAASTRLSQKLADQKASDPKYAETMKACVDGLQELGTTKQADCMLKATRKKEVEACRSER
jgi:hypothetical protein